MIAASSSLNVYLAPSVTDMRKSIDGLSLMVSEVLDLGTLTRFQRACLSSATGGATSSRYCTGKPMAFGFTTVDWKKAALTGPGRRLRIRRFP